MAQAGQELEAKRVIEKYFLLCTFSLSTPFFGLAVQKDL
jgi:hypothetical protein